MRFSILTCASTWVIGMMLSAGPVRAAEVLWTAPDECPKDVFVRELERTTHQPMSELPVSFLEVQVRRYAAATWTATFALRAAPTDGSPTRLIGGESCEDVVGAMAVAIALALHAAQEEPADDNPSEVPEEPTPTLISNDAPSGGSLLDFGVLGGVLLDGALLGQTTLGVQLGVLAGMGRFEMGMSAAVQTPTELRITETLGIQLQGYLGDVYGCFVVAKHRLKPRACMGYQLGLVRGQGTGRALEVSRSQLALWHALRPSVNISVPITEDVDLRVSAGAAIGITRSHFVFDERRSAHELPAVSGQGALGVVWTP